MKNSSVSSDQEWFFADSGRGAVEGPNVRLLMSNLPVDHSYTMVREILQNSIDARTSASEPAVVEFAHYFRDAADIPLIEKLRRPIKSSKNRNLPNEEKNSRLEKFYDEAERILDSSKISILRVSDFNTSGLTNPYADFLDDAEAASSGWLAMVHATTITTKGGDKAGSFGEGKKVIFDHSGLKTLAIGTCTTRGEKAWQAVARIGAFSTGEGEERSLRQGTGFWGEDGTPDPLRDWQTFDPNFQRTEPGTDIEIIGYNGQLSPSQEGLCWHEAVRLACMNDFFVPIQEGDLEVKILGGPGGRNVTLNKETLLSQFSDYDGLVRKLDLKNKKDKIEFQSDYLYDTYINPSVNKLTIDFEKEGVEGNIDLYISRSTEMTTPSDRDPIPCTAMIRSSGMRITNQRYTAENGVLAVATIAGSSLNGFLAGLENSLHQTWKSDDPDEKRILAFFKQTITKRIHEETKADDGVVSEIPELAKWLPLRDEDGEENDSGLDQQPFRKVAVRETATSTRPRKKKQDSEKDERERTGREPARRTENDGGRSGGGSKEPPEKRTPPEVDKPSGRTEPDENGDRTKRESKQEATRPVEVETILRQSPNGLHLYLLSGETAQVDIVVAYATEDGGSDSGVEIVSARDQITGNLLDVKENRIYGVQVSQNQRAEVLVELRGLSTPAMVVSCYAR